MADSSANSTALQFPYGPSLGARLASMWVFWLLSIPCVFAGGFMLHSTFQAPSGPDETFVACSAPFVLLPLLLFVVQLLKHLGSPKIRITGTRIEKLEGGEPRLIGDAAGVEAVVIERSLLHEEFVGQPAASQAHLHTNRVTRASTSEVSEVWIGDALVTRLVNDSRLARKRAEACAQHFGLPVVGPKDRFAA